MGVKRNNAVGLKGRSGRKSKAEEFKEAVETIKSQALIELANRLVYKRMKFMDKLEDDMIDMSGTKDIALPIALKGMANIVAGDTDRPLGIIILPQINADSVEAESEASDSTS